MICPRPLRELSQHYEWPRRANNLGPRKKRLTVTTARPPHPVGPTLQPNVVTGAVQLSAIPVNDSDTPPDTPQLAIIPRAGNSTRQALETTHPSEHRNPISTLLNVNKPTNARNE
jgi:hypothetical protein